MPKADDESQLSTPKLVGYQLQVYQLLQQYTQEYILQESLASLPRLSLDMSLSNMLVGFVRYSQDQSFKIICKE